MVRSQSQCSFELIQASTARPAILSSVQIYVFSSFGPPPAPGAPPNCWGVEPKDGVAPEEEAVVVVPSVSSSFGAEVPVWAPSFALPSEASALTSGGCAAPGGSW